MVGSITIPYIQQLLCDIGCFSMNFPFFMRSVLEPLNAQNHRVVPLASNIDTQNDVVFERRHIFQGPSFFLISVLDNQGQLVAAQMAATN